jgi:hypothetical protein
MQMRSITSNYGTTHFFDPFRLIIRFHSIIRCYTVRAEQSRALGLRQHSHSWFRDLYSASRVVICCWSSAAQSFLVSSPIQCEQSSHLLLAFASTVIFGSGSYTVRAEQSLVVGLRQHSHFWFRVLYSASRVVICGWSSPAQSFSVSGPVGTHDHIFICSVSYLQRS